MSDVSDMLFELYKANVAKAPKNSQLQVVPQNKLGQTSPTSAETEPSTIAAIATNGAAADNSHETAPKNLQGDEMMSNNNNNKEVASGSHVTAHATTSFHPRIKYTSVSKVTTAAAPTSVVEFAATVATSSPIIKAIPTSVLVPTSPQIDVKPLIHPTTGLVISPVNVGAAASVIRPTPGPNTVVPQAAAIAAALLRDGYHNFQQQLRAQELLKQQSAPSGSNISVSVGNTTHQVTPTKLFENFLRQQRDAQQRHSEFERDNDSASDTNDGDDEDDSRYNGFDDIHLIEGSKASAAFHSTAGGAIAAGSGHLNMCNSSAPATADYLSDESQKFMIAAQAQAFRSLEYSLSEYGGSGNGDGEPTYECRHCGKKYRWKSTLRRHENVECGGKEPSHQCPYCPYKSKQRGNLGVHVRKHHSNLPQLASKRRSKYSIKLEGGGGSGGGSGMPDSANASDDSSSKLMIDCSK